MNHYRIVSILRVSIHKDCIGCVYQVLIKSILIYPLENDSVVLHKPMEKGFLVFVMYSGQKLIEFSYSTVSALSVAL
jgi:hypothetical protein